MINIDFSYHFCVLLHLLRTNARHFPQSVDANPWFQAHSTDASVSFAAFHEYPWSIFDTSRWKLEAEGELRLIETFAFRGNTSRSRRFWFADSLVVNINQKVASVNEFKQTQSQQNTEIHSLIQNSRAVKN